MEIYKDSIFFTTKYIFQDKNWIPYETVNLIGCDIFSDGNYYIQTDLLQKGKHITQASYIKIIKALEILMRSISVSLNSRIKILPCLHYGVVLRGIKESWNFPAGHNAHNNTIRALQNKCHRNKNFANTVQPPFVFRQTP